MLKSDFWSPTEQTFSVNVVEETSIFVIFGILSDFFLLIYHFLLRYVSLISWLLSFLASSICKSSLGICYVVKLDFTFSHDSVRINLHFSDQVLKFWFVSFILTIWKFLAKPLFVCFARFLTLFVVMVSFRNVLQCIWKATKRKNRSFRGIEQNNFEIEFKENTFPFH